ncbi:MAG: trigger factor [Myxococcales bacterium]|nr:trigger factor [Myxococcales bacterium]
MQVTVSEISPVEKKVAVEIPWLYVSQKLDEAYKDLSRGVALKGFRKGKVPRPMLEKMFSRQVEQEVVKQLVQESFITAANQHDIQPVAEPIVDDAHLHKGQPFHYSARVEVRSVVEPKEYDGIELGQRAANVSDEDLDSALERKRQELTEFKPIEGRAELGPNDVVVVDVTGNIGDRKFDKEAMMIDLTEPAREPLPGISKALVGLPIAAQQHEVTFVLPTKEENKDVAAELSGARAVLKISVKESREKQMPALDDEFAKDTGEADTLAELREKLRGKLLEGDEKQAREEVKGDLIKELLKRNAFVVAPALVERQLDNMIQRSRLQLAMRGIDYRSAGLDEQRMRDELRESANDEVRAAFLIDAIAEKEKVEVSEADVEKKLAELAQSRDKSVPRLKAELQKEGRLDSLKHQLREEKTLDLLLSRAKISEKAREVSSSSEK